MRASIWGCRGSLSTPGGQTVRYGGNTSCVEVRTSTDALVVLDAGTGIRRLGESLPSEPRRIHLLLTHLHLDHVEGLGFFGPLFDPERHITIWGPPQDGSSLAERIRTYLSPPFFPVPFDRFPATIDFVELGEETWQLDELTVTSAIVAHPGKTLAYRLRENGRALAFIPDNEVGLDPTSGVALADGAELLFHDAQYTQDEYRSRVGWGHTGLEDLGDYLRSLTARRVVMFHHDPSHSDAQLESMRDTAEGLAERGLDLAAEGAAYDV
ncbi:MAG TPA: MBL fold metallo-hydrolase [Gaiellaceae bacterium]